ncbi:chemotaxis protein CheW [Sporolactobacillus sp. THM7-4]|nr:chemotaxis protein CheW [Sporolactobacillus sp. THM7-4]
MASVEGESLKVILFKLNNEMYGVPVDQILSIERIQAITRVPNAPDYVVGIMNLRGLIIPVIDMRRRFRMSTTEPTKDTRIIIVDVGDIKVGLMVDEANEVLDVDPGSVEKTPDIVSGPGSEYINGVAKINDDRLLILLNLQRILYEQEITEIKKIEV